MAITDWTDLAGATSAEELIGGHAMAARLACQQMTAPALELLLDSLERAANLPARPAWELKAAAHAESLRLLTAVGGRRAAGGLASQTRLISDLICAVGPVADGMITSSRQRLLACLRAGDADGAEREVEQHLRVLHYMSRLAARRP